MSRQQDMRPLYDIDRPGPPVDSMSNLKKDIVEKIKGVRWNYHTNEITNADEQADEIINLIESVADEIIGADSTPEQDSWHTANNKLRAEQRDIKSKLIGGE